MKPCQELLIDDFLIVDWKPKIFVILSGVLCREGPMQQAMDCIGPSAAKDAASG
jgi:hypothetical protein